ncbi:protein Brevis radix-like 1 isoform X2 [Macadamia integrifolia]|uniref:protein Brevis radix-like 1 isoform X2 n=1 Tax=Macadamia integrifolia TaxID=60698 RepID=UPI001C4EA51B|nr:protein Brevis radix-like 1 isoform X2 [Macadamia integrifolia]
MAGDETAKCKAAKEVIKSLTAQLKEMAERVPEGSTASSKLGSTARRTASIPISVMNESHLSSLNSPQLASNGLSINPVSCNGANSQTNPAEWVVQDEPGVYLTLNSLPGGGKELRRVRFRDTSLWILLQRSGKLPRIPTLRLEMMPNATSQGKGFMTRNRSNCPNITLLYQDSMLSLIKRKPIF